MYDGNAFEFREDAPYEIYEQLSTNASIFSIANCYSDVDYHATTSFVEYYYYWGGNNSLSPFEYYYWAGNNSLSSFEYYFWGGNNSLSSFDDEYHQRSAII